MLFSKIKYRDGEGVELVTKLKVDGGAAETRDFTCATPPLPELPAALKAFVPFVADLLDVPDAWREQLTVTTLSIDEEPRTKKTGLIVTALKPVEKANDRPLVLNTPRLREWEDDGNEQPKGTYGEDVAALIDAAQSAARAYYRGDRGQTEIFTAAETTAAAPGKTNGTDPAKAPKVRRQRRVKEIEGIGIVHNPEATIPPTDEKLRGQMLVSGVDVPLETIATWTSSQRDGAMAWACAPDGIAMPAWVKEAASLDAWSDRAPVRLTGDAQQEIAASIEAGD